MLNPIGLAAGNLYPLGNVSPSIYESTQMASDNYNQGGFRYDHYFGNNDQVFARLRSLQPQHSRSAADQRFECSRFPRYECHHHEFVHRFRRAPDLPDNRADRTPGLLPQRIHL